MILVEKLIEADAEGECINDLLGDALSDTLADGVFELEGLAASFPTVISTPHKSGVNMSSSYLQIVGSLTAEYEKVSAHATKALSSLA